MESASKLYRRNRRRNTNRRRNRSAFEPLEQRRMLNVAANVTINTSQTFQTIEGLGAGMLQSKLPAEYTDPNFYNLIVDDLGASAARAPLLPLAEKTNDDNDPNHFNWAGFDASTLAEPFGFFQQLKARGVDKFVTSVWTAPAWMKTNAIHAGGGTLRPDVYAE